MLPIPKDSTTLMTTFAPLFTKRVWHHIHILMVGAILAPGSRTITAPYGSWAWHKQVRSTVSSGLELGRVV
jgi:hypothetical protein